MVVIKVKVSMGKKEVMVVIIKEFVVEIHTLKPNLFRLVAHVSCYRVYRWELKLITIYLTVL